MPRQASWPERLEGLKRLRQPYTIGERAIVERLLERFPDAGPIVEVGAGSGQLRSWLPESMLERCIHTDSDAPSLDRLKRDFRAAETRVAEATRLPFEAGSASAVVGLCVFDMFDELEPAFREAHRLLQSGGALVHLLDMMPALAVPFSDIVAGGRIPLPNVFSDDRNELWPQNLLLLERTACFALIDALRPEVHPLPHIFGYYFDRFRTVPFDAQKAAADYDTIAQTPTGRKLFASALMNAFQLGFQLGLPPPQAVPFSTARSFAERMEKAAFAAGFEVEVNDIWASWFEPVTGGEPPYRSFLLGKETRSNERPETTLCPEAAHAPDGRPIVETGMSVFVARRA